MTNARYFNTFDNIFHYSSSMHYPACVLEALLSPHCLTSFFFYLLPPSHRHSMLNWDELTFSEEQCHYKHGCMCVCVCPCVCLSVTVSADFSWGKTWVQPFVFALVSDYGLFY